MLISKQRGVVLLDVLAAVCLAGIGIATLAVISAADSRFLSNRHLELTKDDNIKVTCEATKIPVLFNCRINNQISDAQTTIIP